MSGALRPKMQQYVEQSVTLPDPKVLARSVTQLGQASRPKVVQSDSEAFFPAIDVAEPQVDICANALQGLQLQGTTEVLGVGP